ncbi:MAG: hypothetical protein LBH43_05965 [Treponema sp.]|jgi:hypothetical protein|nr:hypothetical protein [Treponema sp.]
MTTERERLKACGMSEDEIENLYAIRKGEKERPPQERIEFEFDKTNYVHRHFMKILGIANV